MLIFYLYIMQEIKYRSKYLFLSALVFCICKYTKKHLKVH